MKYHDRKEYKEDEEMMVKEKRGKKFNEEERKKKKENLKKEVDCEGKKESKQIEMEEKLWTRKKRKERERRKKRRLRKKRIVQCSSAQHGHMMHCHVYEKQYIVTYTHLYSTHAAGR